LRSKVLAWARAVGDLDALLGSLRRDAFRLKTVAGPADGQTNVAIRKRVIIYSEEWNF